ncbi:hypothetical protein AURANDRAFT_4733, partial [Aureococcus anophagefferens]
MGVQGLWKLLAPCGRRISVETLEHTTLAIDVSIWLTQFVKAMRDDEGRPIRNAHLIGTLRRVAKLLYHGVRPVFVFDGGVPVVKARLIRQRQMRREKNRDDREAASLRREMSRSSRDADSVTEDMREDTMHLLRLLGVPYVVAPMEAEAQCAALEAAGLCEGVVTDDSDAFCFGARRVYKNIFDDRKYVEAYYASDCARDLRLGRDEFCALALLLGGDYDNGVAGVGVVNAMEVLQAF